MNNEMLNNVYFLDKAIVENGGEWPSVSGKFLKVSGPKNTTHQPLSVFDFGCYSSESNDYWVFICTKDQFTQRAKELGFINGYRWGVEYPTNGKRPELAGDIICSVKDDTVGWCSDLTGGYVAAWKWSSVVLFKITDQRYKPADTSYLQTPAVEPVEEVSRGDWWDYETNKRTANPPIGESLLFDDSGVMTESVILYIGKEKMLANISDGSDTEYCMGVASLDFYYPLDHATRKAELEKEKVINAAMDAAKIGDDKSVKLNPCVEHAIHRLYAAGPLRLLESK